MITKTDEQRKKCFEYLTSKGLHPIAPNYVYTERDGQITACCGIIFVGMLEPFASDDKIDGLKVFSYAQGLISARTDKAFAMTDKEDVKRILEKDDFQMWGDLTNYIKEL